MNSKENNILKEAEKLLNSELFESAEHILLFYIYNNIDNPLFTLHGLHCLARSYKMQCKYSKAIEMLKRCIDNLALLGVTDTSFNNSCYIHLNQYEKGYSSLSSFPLLSLPSSGLSILGRIAEKTNRKITAMECYQLLLASNSYNIEASIGLTRLGATLSRSFSTSLPSLPWMTSYLNIYYYTTKSHLKNALNEINTMLLSYSRNPYLYYHKGNILLQMGHYDESIVAFEECRRIDLSFIDGMDKLGFVYRKRHNHLKLAELTHSLLSLNESLSATYCVAALFEDSIGNKEKAINCADKAISLGLLYLDSSKEIDDNETALNLFLLAYNRNKYDIYLYKGLVDGSILIGKLKDALEIAKSALKLMPKHPKALCLVGNILANSYEGKEKAKLAYEKALSFDPKCVDAILMLSTLEANLGNVNKAIKLLKENFQSLDKTKMGYIYLSNSDVTSAMLCFHSALSLNPDYPPAAKALANIQDDVMNKNDESNIGFFGDEF